jgi:hypothetical protein
MVILEYVKNLNEEDLTNGFETPVIFLILKKAKW